MNTTTHPIARVITNTRARQAIYGVYVVALVIVGGTQAGFAAVEAVQPEWLTISLAVLAYLGIPVGALALANAPTTEEIEDVYTDE